MSMTNQDRLVTPRAPHPERLCALAGSQEPRKWRAGLPEGAEEACQ